MAMEKTTSTERHIQSNLQIKQETHGNETTAGSVARVYYCIEMFTQIQLQNIQA